MISCNRVFYKSEMIVTDSIEYKVFFQLILKIYTIIIYIWILFLK